MPATKLAKSTKRSLKEELRLHREYSLFIDSPLCCVPWGASRFVGEAWHSVGGKRPLWSATRGTITCAVLTTRVQ
jgi:hypothetical protein